MLGRGRGWGGGSQEGPRGLPLAPAGASVPSIHTTCKSHVVAAEVTVTQLLPIGLHRRYGRRADALWGLKPAGSQGSQSSARAAQPVTVSNSDECQYGGPRAPCHRQLRPGTGAAMPAASSRPSCKGCGAVPPAAGPGPAPVWIRVARAHPARSQASPHLQRPGLPTACGPSGQGPGGLPDPALPVSPQNQRRRGKGPDGLYQVSAMPVSATPPPSSPGRLTRGPSGSCALADTRAGRAQGTLGPARPAAGLG